MKRRDFLISTSGLVSSVIPFSARGLPCPPSITAVSGGTSAATTCSQLAALADWNTRSQAPGVIWAHRFNSADSVGKFIVASDRSSAAKYVRFQAADGILGDGCLEINTPAGDIQYGSWGRPMQPIPGDINMPNLSTGSNITDATNAFVNWRGGHFANIDYHKDPRWPGQCIGTDFYLQYRVKFSRGRFNSDEPSGKVMMLVTGYQTPTQEIVTTARTSYGGGFYNMYTSVGSSFNSALTDPQGAYMGASLQPNSPFKDTCVIGQDKLGGTYNNCWVWPTEEWVTVLIHVIPGHQAVIDNLSSSSNPKDTGIEVWVARAGQSTYSKIWDKKDYIWEYGVSYIDGTPQPYGWNWINFTAFTGGATPVPSVNGFYHRHDQIIFSNQFIQCPAV